MASSPWRAAASDRGAARPSGRRSSGCTIALMLFAMPSAAPAVGLCETMVCLAFAPKALISCTCAVLPPAAKVECRCRMRGRTALMPRASSASMAACLRLVQCRAWPICGMVTAVASKPLLHFGEAFPREGHFAAQQQQDVRRAPRKQATGQGGRQLRPPQGSARRSHVVIEAMRPLLASVIPRLAMRISSCISTTREVRPALLPMHGRRASGRSCLPT